jgi:hypothetical protein
VAASIDGTNRDLHLHPRLSPAAAVELGTLLHALQPVSLRPDVPGCQGIGQDMTTFSSKGFYHHHMSQLLVDSFATCIRDNVALPRCRHFVWLLHRRWLSTAALLHHRNIIDSPFYGYYDNLED